MHRDIPRWGGLGGHHNRRGPRQCDLAGTAPLRRPSSPLRRTTSACVPAHVTSARLRRGQRRGRGRPRGSATRRQAERAPPAHGGARGAQDHHTHHRRHSSGQGGQTSDASPRVRARLCCGGVPRPILRGEELRFGVHAVDLAWRPAQRRHGPYGGRGGHAGGRGPRWGETRPPAACARMGSAKRSRLQPTFGVPRDAPMGVVRDVIGGSLLLSPTRLGERDTTRLGELRGV